ncbi:hypothetical protein SALBM311S_12975 [Streptomyces alboniger]
MTASWQRAAAPVLRRLDAALARGVVGVDMNDDHLACWHLACARQPASAEPERYFYDLTGTAQHRERGRSGTP